MKHRPIGIGIQGLSDTYMLMRIPFESEEALKLNNEIFDSYTFLLIFINFLCENLPPFFLILLKKVFV